MLTKSYDVIIAGAGPAGLNTARILAEAGLHVLIVESKSGAGVGVVCAGVVGREIFEKFPISRASVLREFKEGVVRSSSGRSINYSEPEPFAYTIDRSAFDSELLKSALDAGAEAIFNTWVVNAEVKGDGVIVGVSRKEGGEGKLTTEVLVIATGVNNRLQKLLGLGYPQRFLKAVQAEVDLHEVLPLTVFVGNEISDSAFGWAIPLGGNRMRIGLMAEDDSTRRFKRLFEVHLPGIYPKNFNVKPIVQDIVHQTFSDRVIVVGEAAGQVKTTTGGGIYYGLLCSRIAAETLINAFRRRRFDADALSEYEISWKRLIGREIKAGLMVRRLCSYLNDRQIDRILDLARSDGIIDFLRKEARFDWHSLTLLKLLGQRSIREIFS